MKARLSPYILVFSPKGLSVTGDQLQQFISNNKHIEKWWNFIPLCYAITSNSDVDTLRDMFKAFLSSSDADFIVAKVDDRNIDGHLPREAWDAYLQDIEEPSHQENKD